MEDSCCSLGDEELRSKRQSSRNAWSGESPSIRSCRRPLRQYGRPSKAYPGYEAFLDVQVIGGMVLHEGNGCRNEDEEREDPRCYYACLPECPEWQRCAYRYSQPIIWPARCRVDGGRIYNFLGMSVGRVVHGLGQPGKKGLIWLLIYTYGTNNQFGFGYLSG